jgi:hypothetical protein
MGLGMDNVYLINTDSAGKIDASHLGKLCDTQWRLSESSSSLKHSILARTQPPFILDLIRFYSSSSCSTESEILRAKTEGALPFMVSATAGENWFFIGNPMSYVLLLLGTTVLGAFDPLEKIADLCEKYKMWMHVDAAWGGGALMSQKYRKLLKGIER